MKAHALRNTTAALATAALMAATVGVVSYATAPVDAEASTHGVHNNSKGHTRSRQAVKFRNEMRKLWEDRIKQFPGRF